jgi:hypothetical protein
MMSEGPDKTDELYPIAVLIDELKVDINMPNEPGNLQRNPLTLP